MIEYETFSERFPLDRDELLASDQARLNARIHPRVREWIETVESWGWMVEGDITLEVKDLVEYGTKEVIAEVRACKHTIENFLRLRIDEIVAEVPMRYRIRETYEALHKVIDWHSNWPVLLEKKAVLTVFDDYDPSTVAYKMSKDIAWMTQSEYIKRFTTDPPSAPILKILAQQWRHHKYFKPEWSI